MRRHLLLREACLSSALTSYLSGLIRARSPPCLYSSQAVNRRAAMLKPASPARETLCRLLAEVRQPGPGHVP
jgi:hypothetical protein